MKSLVSVIALSSCLVAESTVTLSFTGFFNALTNLSDSDGTSAVNGLTWGIIIDTQRDGFSDFGISLGQEPVVLADGIFITSDDLLLFGGTTSSVPMGFLEQGDGAIRTATFDPFAFPGVDENDPFRIIWFDAGVEEGSLLLPSVRYGNVANVGLLIPSDGSTTGFEGLFEGNEPIRPTNLVPDVEAVAICSSQLEVAASDNQRFGIEFTIASAFADEVAFSLEQSSTLTPTSWSESSTSPTVLSDNGTLATLQLLSPNTVGDAESLFFRLAIAED